MAKTRTLPDKFYDKNYETNGIHRVPLWRIGCFALNNTATNLYMFLMNYATYYLMGWVGVGMMVASSLTMAMRIWDGVTDPFVGFMVDKTNGKFGKNRPFMVIGNILLAVTSFVAFHVTHNLPQAARFPFYVVVLMVYYLGYTCQCVVTKSAQSCVTKDRPEFFGTGKPVKVGLKDYWDTLKNNRAIQMLVLSASTDKLGNTAKTSAVQVALFACIAGSTLLQGNVTALTTVPVCILTFLCISTLATKFGQRKGMIIGSVGALIGNGALIALWLLGDPTTMTSNPETGALNWGYFLILYIVLTVLTGGFQNLAGNIVIPMTADCADYEVYRSGKYVPGLMGTLFSFVDKLVSSFAPMIAGVMFTACGFADHNPVMGDPVTMKLRIGTALCAYGVIMIGLVCNLIAMHFYPLTKEKMAEIQDEVVKIKMAAAQNA